MVVNAEKLARKVSLISIAVSGGLAVSKLVIGYLAGSNSVMADGVESAGDVVASSLILFGLWVAARPPDENHPYGHGRFEMLTGLAVGMGLAIELEFQPLRAGFHQVEDATGGQDHGAETAFSRPDSPGGHNRAFRPTRA